MNSKNIYLSFLAVLIAVLVFSLPAIAEDKGPLKNGDEVSLEYTGTLKDGTVFDSSEKHGKPVDFPPDQDCDVIFVILILNVKVLPANGGFISTVTLSPETFVMVAGRLLPSGISIPSIIPGFGSGLAGNLLREISPFNLGLYSP